MRTIIRSCTFHKSNGYNLGDCRNLPPIALPAWTWTIIIQRRPRAPVPTLSHNSAVVRRLTVVGFLCAAMLTIGCDQQEQITTYTVASHESLQTPEFVKESAKRKPRPARMLAGILPQGTTLWFISLKGPPDAVADRVKEFRELLSSVKLRAGNNLAWTLPAGWQERPGSESLYATLIPPGSGALEAYVIKVPASPDLSVKGIVNFCRNQLQLLPIEAEDVPYRTEKIQAGTSEFVFLDITGKVKQPRPMQEPAEKAEPVQDAAPSIPFKMPAEWTQVRPKMFTMAAFQVTDGDKHISITLSRAGGTKVANVNRWRGQMGLAPATDDEIQKSLQKITVGSRKGELLELKKEGEIMLGLMLPDGNQTVFVKMTGDPELAARERERLIAFAASLKF
jgi:hypothetical protein